MIRNFSKTASLFFVLGLTIGNAAAQSPRLLLDPSSTAGETSLSAPSELQVKVKGRLVREADRVLNQPLETYTFVQGTLLTTSRDILAHIMTTGLAYRETGDPRYARRAIDQAMLASDFPDWNPVHFLDTAEMTLAISLAYDWLKPELTAGEEAKLRAAIVEKGLRPGLRDFQRKASWTTRGTNWTQVGGASMAMAAIAVQEREPLLSAQILKAALPAVQRSLRDYRPNGIPSEGPVYWRYGMAFHTMLNRTLVNNFGPERNLFREQAMSETAWYPVYVQGPTGKNFNFGDSSDWFVPTPATLELARATGQPEIAWWTQQRVAELIESSQPWTEEHRLSALFLAWDAQGIEINPNALALDREFRGNVDIVSMRSSWTDTNAAFVGIKGGRNGVPHGHLDLGSFVYEANGVRWAMDLGKDSYSLPGYFSSQRYSYYRTSTRSQNTVSFGGNQATNGRATLRTGLGGQSPWAQLDLTTAYRGQARQVLRGFQFNDRSSLVVTDQVVMASRPWRWQMVTGAQIELNGQQAILRQDGQTLIAEIVAPAQAQFAVASTDPGDARQNPNRGTSMLVVQMPTGSSQLQVRLTPVQP